MLSLLSQMRRRRAVASDPRCFPPGQCGGSSAVWVVYPTMSLVEGDVQDGIRQVKAPDPLVEERLFGGRKFTLALAPLFTDPGCQITENQDRTEM
jgi:hypothetical protein